MTMRMKKRKGRKIGMIDEWSDLHPALLPFQKTSCLKTGYCIFHSGVPENNLQESLLPFFRAGVTSDLRKRLFQRFDNIIDVFNTDGKANEVRRQTTRFLLLFVQLGMGGGRWMKYQAFGIAYIGQVGKQFKVVHKRFTRF